MSTPRRTTGSRRKTRHHAAAGSRIVAGALSVATFLGIVGATAAKAANARATQPTNATTEPSDEQTVDPGAALPWETAPAIPGGAVGQAPITSSHGS